MPGEEWNSTDVMDGRPSSAAEIIWHRGNRWLFVTGYGGIGSSYDVVTYDIGSDGGAARVAVPIEVQSYDKICKLARAFF